MPAKIKYQYQLLRYKHDRVTDEFVNVGLVIYSAEQHYLKCQVISKYTRVSSFFNHKSDSSSLTKALKQLEVSINQTGAELQSLFRPEPSFVSITEITSHILPKDDNALYFTEEQSGLDYNLDGAFHDLYQRFIDYYTIPKNIQKITSDKDVWSKYYKRYFDSLGISGKLKEHKVVTNTDKFTFEKSWKNGNWHCFQTLALSSNDLNKVKDKLYKWSGILDNLEEVQEPLDLFFLTTQGGQEQEIHHFIDFNIKRHQTDKLRITLVTEGEAEAFAKQLQQEIVKHEDVS